MKAVPIAVHCSPGKLHRVAVRHHFSARLTRDQSPHHCPFWHPSAVTQCLNRHGLGPEVRLGTQHRANNRVRMVPAQVPNALHFTHNETDFPTCLQSRALPTAQPRGLEAVLPSESSCVPVVETAYLTHLPQQPLQALRVPYTRVFSEGFPELWVPCSLLEKMLLLPLHLSQPVIPHLGVPLFTCLFL